MEHPTGSDHPIVHHDPLQDGGFGTEEVRAPAGGSTRVFALVQEFTADDGGEGVAKVIAYGLELPCGTAATVGVDQGFGRWRSARSAAARMGSELVWLGEDSA